MGKRYLLGKALGSGAMGTVCRALDQLTGQTVALKTLNGGFLHAPPGAPERKTLPALSLRPPPDPGDEASTALAAEGLVPTPVGPDNLDYPTVEQDVGGLRRLAGATPAERDANESTVLPERFEEDDELDTLAPGAAGSEEDQRITLRRLALANEFQVLASLRHPNIISVLDFGFDEHRQPYVAMELLEGASSLLEAAQGLDAAGKVDLLIQTLQALAYLHRRGVLHRDLKPDNVLVCGGRVKVLDFGVALQQEDIEAQGEEIAGTLPYLAPEILLKAEVSVASDLYAVGIIGYQLFAGRHPFATKQRMGLLNQILGKVPDTGVEGIPAGVAEVLDTLLAKDPGARYRSAKAAIAAFSQAIAREVPEESETIRESFLQAARFVGRGPELHRLSEALGFVSEGRGSVWLVGGESGVGKSRLLDELRTRGLVRQLLVLGGQGTSESKSAYQLWRDALRRLSLLGELSELEAGVLKEIVPDLPSLLSCTIPDAPELDPQSAKARVVSVIEQVFGRQDTPTLLLLEDLHWAAAEDLVVLRRLLATIAGRPLMIVASYRNDERPHLLEELPGARGVELGRLTKNAVAELAGSMLGELGRSPGVVELLMRETEGNVFFLVEVVRALAERAGRLDRIDPAELPARIFPGGVQRIVEHRLDKVPAGDRRLLGLAAVAGRELDLELLRAAAPQVALEPWLARCAEVTVLAVQDDRWRFAHDKLREGLLQGLEPAELGGLHRDVAQGIEVAHADELDEHAMVLAHHWGGAGNAERECHYTLLSGRQALRLGAYQRAAELLERALAIQLQLEQAPLVVAGTEQQLGQAYFGMGDMARSRKHLEGTAARLGSPVPASPLGLGWRLLGQALRQLCHRLLPRRLIEDPRRAAAWREVARAHERLAHVYFFDNKTPAVVLASLSALNAAERAGPSGELSRAFTNLALSCGFVPLHAAARAYDRSARDVAAAIEDPAARTWAIQLHGIYEAGLAHWDEAERELKEAVKAWEGLGDRRRWEESLTLLGMVHYHEGDTTQARELRVRLHEVGVRSSSQQTQTWGLVGQGENALLNGETQAAVTYLEQALREDQAIGIAERIWLEGLRARAYMRAGVAERALNAAGAAADLIAQSMPTAFYALEGYAGTAETFLGLAGAKPTDRALRKAAQNATRALSAFARVFPMGSGRAALHQGRWELLCDAKGRAERTWRRGLERARRLHLLYDQGLLALALAAHPRVERAEREALLGEAIERFKEVDARYELRRAMGSGADTVN